MLSISGSRVVYSTRSPGTDATTVPPLSLPGAASKGPPRPSWRKVTSVLNRRLSPRRAGG